MLAPYICRALHSFQFPRTSYSHRTYLECLIHCRTPSHRTIRHHLNIASTRRTPICLRMSRPVPKAFRYKCCPHHIGQFPRTHRSPCKSRYRFSRFHNFLRLRIFHGLCMTMCHRIGLFLCMFHSPSIVHQLKNIPKGRTRKRSTQGSQSAKSRKHCL